MEVRDCPQSLCAPGHIAHGTARSAESGRSRAGERPNVVCSRRSGFGWRGLRPRFYLIRPQLKLGVRLRPCLCPRLIVAKESAVSLTGLSPRMRNGRRSWWPRRSYLLWSFGGSADARLIRCVAEPSRTCAPSRTRKPGRLQKPVWSIGKNPLWVRPRHSLTFPAASCVDPVKCRDDQICKRNELNDPS
jgi:hypothetical protein